MHYSRKLEHAIDKGQKYAKILNIVYRYTTVIPIDVFKLLLNTQHCIQKSGSLWEKRGRNNNRFQITPFKKVSQTSNRKQTLHNVNLSC